MKEIVIHTFKELVGYEYENVKISPNQNYISILDKNRQLHIISLINSFEKTIEKVQSYNWAILNKSENLIYQSSDRLYIYDPHSNSNFVLQTLVSDKVCTIDSYRNAFIIITPLENEHSFDINIYDTSLRLFSVTLHDIICFNSAHRLSLFIHKNGEISILSPEEPHHLHVYLSFLSTTFNDLRSFSFSKELQNFVFCNGKKVIVFTPITHLTDEPYKELLEMDSKNPLTFTSYDLEQSGLSEHIFVSQTGIYIIQKFTNKFILLRVGSEERIDQHSIQIVGDTIFPVYISDNKLIAAVSGDSRRMLLTLINGGFGTLINYITDLNPQFAVDSADSRILITLEHALETVDSSEVDKAVDKLIEKNDNQLLSAALKIFVDHLGIETPRDIIQVCLKACKFIAQNDLMGNVDMLGEAIRKIGNADEKIRRESREQRCQKVKKVFGEEFDHKKQEINNTLKMIDLKCTNKKLSFEDIILNGNIPSNEINDSDLIIKGQALCMKKAQEGKHDIAIKIALRIGIEDLSKMLLTLIMNTTNSLLRQSCIEMYYEIDPHLNQFDIDFINTYDHRRHTKLNRKYDVFIVKGIEEISPFDGDIPTKIAQKYGITSDILPVVDEKELCVVRVNDIINANERDKSFILAECGENECCVDQWELVKYFISHNKEDKVKEWIKGHLDLIKGEEDKKTLWRLIEYYCVDPSKRVIKDFIEENTFKPDSECLKDQKEQLIHPHPSISEKQALTIVEEYKSINNLPLIDSCIEGMKITKFPVMWMNQIHALHSSYEEAILMNTLKHLDAPLPMDGKLKEPVFNLLLSKPQLSNILNAFFEENTKTESASSSKLNGICHLTTTNGDLSLTQLYSNTFQRVYDPLIEGPFGFVPRKSIPEGKNWLNCEYYLTQKQCVFAKMNQEITDKKLCELIVANDAEVRTCCSFISNNPYIKLVTVLHEDLQTQYDYIFKHYPSLQSIKNENMIDYHLLFESNFEIKEEFVKCYDELMGSSYPPTKGWDRLGYLCNIFQVPLRPMQLQILSRKQAFLEMLIFADKHGYKWSDVKDLLIQYSGDVSIAKHISNAIGALSKISSERGLLTILLEDSPLEAFSIFIGSSTKTINSTKDRIIEMVQEDCSCRLLRLGFFLFDCTNALRHFFDICGLISQTNFEDIESNSEQIDLKCGMIGNEEWRKSVIEDCLDIVVSWWQQRSPMRLEKLIGYLKGKNLGENVKLKIKKYCNIIELIEKTQLSLSLIESPIEFIEKMTNARYFEETYHHINEFEPRFLFKVIEKEANQMVGKQNWKSIDELLQRRKAPALEAIQYYQEHIDQLVKTRNELNYQTINIEVVEIMELKEQWFDILERQNSNGNILQMHAENKQILATYQQAVREHVPVEALINPTVKSVYYVLNTSNYSLAQQMNETVHAEEIEVFNEVLKFITSAQSYTMKLEEGIEQINSIYKGTTHINPIVELLKIRYEMIHKYFEDKSLLIYNAKAIDFLQNICGPKVVSKYSNKVVEWSKVFEDAKRFVEAERIDQNELGRLLANNFIEITNTIKPVCVIGWSTPNILAYLNILSKVADIVKPMLNLLENVTTINTLAEALILCHTAAKNANSTELMKEVLTKIQKSLVVFLIPHNHSYLVRVITRTKAYDDIRIPRLHDSPTTLVKYFISEAMTDKDVDYRVILPKHDQKDAFETLLYYQSDLAEIKDEIGITSNPLYETLLAETYSYLNDSIEGGNLFFNKAKKIVDTAIMKMCSKKGCVDNAYSDILEAMSCYTKAAGFFCNGQEYYWANKCGQQINLLALQIFYNNVQIIGLTHEKAKNQLMYISDVEDAVLFATAYNLLELHQWIPSIFEQCFVRQNINYIEEWRKVFNMDNKTWEELVEYIDRPQKQIKKKEIAVLREQFMKKCHGYWPELFCCQDGVALTEGILKPEIKEMIQNAHIIRNIYITDIVAIDDDNNFDH
ncbi:hypothetical protein ENUP19_0084G0021 [Entamoeba nuttalli]|uniref:Spatacsin C-terminal domain-containing protein n=1 Tax=Entamoeba nuttalli TaxID=412467 RepID=A0ABQ0DFZ7_9EUKA